jgi:hypothetical protein
LTVKLVNEKKKKREKRCDYEQQGQNEMAWIKEGEQKHALGVVITIKILSVPD